LVQTIDVVEKNAKPSARLSQERYMIKKYSFSRQALNEIRGIGDSIGFSFGDKLEIFKQHNEVFHVINFQLTNFGQKSNFYVNYGISAPLLNKFWGQTVPKNNFGLVISNRLYWSSGQGFPCLTMDELMTSIAELKKNLPTALSWFNDHMTISELTEAFCSINSLSAIGNNLQLKRLKVMQYAFLKIIEGKTIEAKSWLQEAKFLMKPDDAFEIDLIERALNSFEL
jgi:hypothetical protein